MSSYEKPCAFCKQEIKMSDSSSKWLPYNLDNWFYECTSQNKLDSKANELTLEKPNTRLLKVEAMLKEFYESEPKKWCKKKIFLTFD